MPQLIALMALLLAGCAVTAPTQPTGKGDRETQSHPWMNLAAPAAGERIGGELEVRGQARGQWFFEASFPLELVTTDGETLLRKPVTAQDEWMTTDFVPFAATISLPSVDRPTEATLILHRANPSDLPKNDASIRIPVTLVPATFAD
ncbi:MAG: hypothetical protein HKN49_10240 [Gammaproteobacteria bacterium]|nr:hypothetical protein [Gammaproteobacteria bacterium]